MISLYPRQQEFKDDLREALRKVRRVLGLAATGMGKTVTFASISADVAARNKSVVLIAHRIEIVEQISAALIRVAGLEHGVIAPGHKFRRGPVIVAMVQSLANRLADIPEPALLVIDECFPAGTLIDGLPIEAIRVGDYVRTFDEATGLIELGLVTRTFKRKAGDLVTVRFASGRNVTATRNHPFFTDTGWINASELTAGQPVYTDPMHDVRHPLPVSNEGQAIRLDEVRERLLLGPVPGHLGLTEQFGADGADEQKACVTPHEVEQPDGETGCKGENAQHPSRHRPQAHCARRKRMSDVAAAEPASCGVGAGLGSGALGSGGKGAGQLLADALQDRHCASGAIDSDRSGRRQPWDAGKARARREEGYLSAVDRVVSVEVHERPSAGEPCDVCPDGMVYNFEVEGTHTYFAGGIAVHNCHHATAGSYTKIASTWSSARILGVTATAARTDGRGLGHAFDALVIGPQTRELIEMKRLSDFRYFKPPMVADLSGMKVRAGDYAAEQVADAMDRRSVTGDTIKHYADHLNGRPAIAFCATVAHAEHVAEQFRNAGWNAASVDGNMDLAERHRRIQAIGNGGLNVLTSVDCVSEGTDIPAVYGALLLRPTQSLIVYIQQIGRVLRLKQDGSPAIILDHVGNLTRFGLPDEPREWSLDGTKAKNKGPVASFRQCPECYSCHRLSPRCIECGHVYETSARQRDLRRRDGELEEVTGPLPPKMFRGVDARQVPLQALLRMCDHQEDVFELGRLMGYKPFWAITVIKRHRLRPRRRVA